MRISGTLEGPFSFTALEATFEVPADFNAVQIDNADVVAFIFGELEGTSQGGPIPDPGLWIAIVPEPSSLALLGLGGLLVARRRGRDA